MTGRHTSPGVFDGVDLGELPAPLTPADCDLRGFGYLPTFGQRLYGSRFYSLALRNPRAGLAGMKLWWEAWTQCPAASLPNDDFDLARMADFGGDLKGWRAGREIALHGFTMCSDGRFYQPFLASEAVKSYEIRLRSDKRRESDRERLVSGAREISEVPPPPNQKRTTSAPRRLKRPRKRLPKCVAKRPLKHSLKRVSSCVKVIEEKVR